MCELFVPQSCLNHRTNLNQILDSSWSNSGNNLRMDLTLPTNTFPLLQTYIGQIQATQSDAKN